MSQLVTLYMAGREPTAGLVGSGMALWASPTSKQLLSRT